MFKDLKKVKIQNIFTETDKAPGFGLVALFKRLLKYLNISYIDTCCNETFTGTAGIPTWQQTLTRSSELTEEVIITGEEPFQFSMNNQITISASDTLGEYSTSIEMYPNSLINHLQLQIVDTNTGNDRYLRINPNDGFTFGYDGGNGGFTIPGGTTPAEGDIMVCGGGSTFYFANPSFLSKPIRYIEDNTLLDPLTDYTIVLIANTKKVTLPSISLNPELEGRIFVFKNLSGVADTFTIETDGVEVIDIIDLQIILSQKDSATLQATATGWITI